MTSLRFSPKKSGKPRRSRYNTGRWMKEEHEAFLRGVDLYDKDWHLIATVVRTRSVLQIRTHGQKYFTKVAKGEVFPLEPYRSMYDKPSSSSSTPAAPPPPPFVHGGDVVHHQLNGPANSADTCPWVGKVCFDMCERSGISGSGSGGGGGGGSFSRAQLLRHHYQHTQLQAGEQHHHQTMASVAGPVGSTGFAGASHAMLQPMTPASAGAFGQVESSGSSAGFSSPSAPSLATNWGTPSGIDNSRRFGESMHSGFVEPASMSTTAPPFCANSGANGSFLPTPGYSGVGFAGAAASGWPGGGVPGDHPEGMNGSGVGGQFCVPQQQQQQQQQQQHMQTGLDGWDHPQGHQQPLLPEGLGPLEGWLNSPLLQEEEAGTEDPDGDLALDSARDFDSLGAL